MADHKVEKVNFHSCTQRLPFTIKLMFMFTFTMRERS